MLTRRAFLATTAASAIATGLPLGANPIVAGRLAGWNGFPFCGDQMIWDDLIRFRGLARGMAIKPERLADGRSVYVFDLSESARATLRALS